MTKPYDLIVFIGRFQPFHLGHYKVVQEALTQTDKLLFILGGSNSPCNSRNPYSIEEREHLIIKSLTPKEISYIRFQSIPDYADDEVWMTALENIINQVVTSPNDKVAIIGHEKDSSSYYLRQCAEKWHVIMPPNIFMMSASDVRDNLYNELPIDNQMVNTGAAQSAISILEGTTNFTKFKREYANIKLLETTRSNSKFPIEYVQTVGIVKYKEFYLVLKTNDELSFPSGTIENNRIAEETIVTYILNQTNIVTPLFNLKPMDYKRANTTRLSLYGASSTYTYVYDLSANCNLPKINKSSQWLHYLELLNLEPNFNQVHFGLFLQHLIK